ncbi:hypothetical protein [Massilia rubra]|uniref:Uncharacterized protein n=1 Tax=Massilia rubra TaxID=2607910 RepID=A0ABX0LC38_9BURK|nr:hypothetical protein [Massilia rubra]NHZ32324.1 hypothetical protein [Massilia rubra]
MKHRLPWLLAVLTASCTFPLAANAKLDDPIFPERGVPKCERHVDGFVGDQGERFSATEYQHGSYLDVDTVLRFYTERFGRAPTQDKGDPFSWIFRENGAEMSYLVRPMEAGGLWYHCNSIPSDVRTVVFVSTVYSSDIRATPRKRARRVK